MYCSQLTQKTSFKMEREEFNSFINNLSTTKTTNENMQVSIGLIVRTANTNEILSREGKQLMLVSPVILSNHIGYFALMNTIKDTLENHFPDFQKILPEQIRNTVLMPVGVFQGDKEVVVYFNLVVDTELKSVFANNNYSYNFKKIDENLLSNLKGYDIIVKDTLTLVSN